MGAWATEITDITAKITAKQAAKTQLDSLVTFFTNLPAGTTKEELSTALVNSTNKNDQRVGYTENRDEEEDQYTTWDATQDEVDAHIAARLSKFTTASSTAAGIITALTDKKAILEQKEAGTHAQSNHQPL